MPWGPHTVQRIEQASSCGRQMPCLGAMMNLVSEKCLYEVGLGVIQEGEAGGAQGRVAEIPEGVIGVPLPALWVRGAEYGLSLLIRIPEPRFH